MLDVIFLDNHLLVVNKPAGMLSQADETGDDDILSAGKRFIKEHFQKPGAVYLGLVQRLDRPASGLMIFARTSKAAARLSQQFRQHQPEKTYLAIVSGTPPDQGDWHDYLAKTDRISRVVTANHPRAKHAKLSFRRLATQGGFSLVSISLETGRAHQIRLQFATRGHVLLGDFRYGSKTPFDGRNLALHAYRLALRHPVTGRTLEFELSPPTTWNGYFNNAIAGLNLPEPPVAKSW